MIFLGGLSGHRSAQYELGTAPKRRPPPASCQPPAPEPGHRKRKPQLFLSTTHVDELVSLARSSGARNVLQTLWERTAKPLGICDAVPGWEVQDAGKGTHLRRVEVCRAGRWGRLGGSALDLPGGGQGCAGGHPAPRSTPRSRRITPTPLAARPGAPEPGWVPQLGTGTGNEPGPGRRPAGSGAAPGGQCRPRLCTHTGQGSMDG